MAGFFYFKILFLVVLLGTVVDPKIRTPKIDLVKRHRLNEGL